MFKSIIYSTLEFLVPNISVKRKFHGNTIKLPFRLRNYFNDNYESETIKFINDFVFDNSAIIVIGSHIGFYTILFGVLTKDSSIIYSFEPLESNFHYLKKSININDLNNVKPINKAISNANQKQIFYSKSAIGYNAGSLVKNPLNEKIEMQTESIDNFTKANKIKNIQLVKIDVEGFEMQVLRGGQDVFKRLKPTLILALHPSSIEKNGDSLIDIWRVLEKFNYKIYSSNTLIDRETFTNNTNLFDVICK